MTLDRTALARAVSDHGAVMRVVVAEVFGSAPREVGAAMLVWPDGQDGTIGGGALEFEAAARARGMLAIGEARDVQKAMLGPDMGQCCGGAVTLLYESWTTETLDHLDEDVHARPLQGDATTPPLAVERLRAQARSAGARPRAALVEGWFIEPIVAQQASLWIWGAGHVGRALVATLAPNPDIAITWVDTGPERFPDDIAPGVTPCPRPDIAAAVAEAPLAAHHLVLTYSHALDLALCDALLTHGFASTGLIGSRTKWARFRARLGQMGHGADAIARIQCPIGDKTLGKHPQAIAVGVAYALLREVAKKEAESPAPRDEGNGDDRRALDA